jgi:DNA-binding NarL/FixJ family response regulator
MPGKSGFETFRALAEIDPDVCVVFTSGYERAVFPDGFFDDRRHAFLEKPYDPRTLLQTLRRALGHG